MKDELLFSLNTDKITTVVFKSGYLLPNYEYTFNLKFVTYLGTDSE